MGSPSIIVASGLINRLRTALDPNSQDAAAKRAAIAELHETLYPKIVRYIGVRIGDFAEAEDLGSEVFVRALRAADRYKEKGTPLEAWLFRIAHNLMVDHLKRRGRAPVKVPFDKEEVLQVTGQADPYQNVEREEEAETVRAAMAQLTDAQRQVLALRFSDADMTSEEVAQVLGKKPTAVREMQSAAIKRLRTLLGVDGEES
ncbi:MAG: sigma-70 family RNA polymerase sigma factor [Dehalococcoidia bacterium]